MKNLKMISSAVALTMIVAACSSNQASRDLDHKLTLEKNVETQSELTEESKDTIENATGITESQRMQLNQLRAETRSKTQEQNLESLRLRSVLVKTMVEPNYKIADLTAVKNRLIQTEENKTTILLDAIKRANFILGRQAISNVHMMRDFYE